MPPFHYCVCGQHVWMRLCSSYIEVFTNVPLFVLRHAGRGLEARYWMESIQFLASVLYPVCW